MKMLQEEVVSLGADLGIATDGDGDRIFFVDNRGETVDPAILRGVLAQIFLRERHGAVIGYDIRPGRITRDLIEEAGGKPVVMRVGHSLIKEHSRKVGAYFAGESSGHFFLDLGYGIFEVPVIVILKILEELSSFEGDAYSFFSRYKRYFHSGEINSDVKEKEKKLDEIRAWYKDGKINDLDGVTVEFDDWWFNVRPSNTEDTLRLNLEARTKDMMEVKRDEVLKFIRS